MNGDSRYKRLFFASLGGWVLLAGLFAYFFVHGVTRKASDHRIEVVLSQAERDLVLGEMRILLESVDGVLAGIADGNHEKAAAAARGGGMVMAADINPSLIAKLPLAFKNLGMGVHRDMDELAAFLEGGPEPKQAIARLKGVTGSCVGCHAAYRLSPGL